MLFDSLDNQLRLKSPKTSNSELLNWEIKSPMSEIELEMAEGGLYTTLTESFLEECIFKEINSNE